jgi:hypothetical protein
MHFVVYVLYSNYYVYFGKEYIKICTFWVLFRSKYEGQGEYYTQDVRRLCSTTILHVNSSYAHRCTTKGVVCDSRLISPASKISLLRFSAAPEQWDQSTIAD